MIVRINIHIYIMPRFSVNYNNIWKEVSSAEFVNMAPLSEYDLDSVRRLAKLI